MCLLDFFLCRHKKIIKISAQTWLRVEIRSTLTAGNFYSSRYLRISETGIFDKQLNTALPKICSLTEKITIHINISQEHFIVHPSSWSQLSLPRQSLDTNMHEMRSEPISSKQHKLIASDTAFVVRQGQPDTERDRDQICLRKREALGEGLTQPVSLLACWLHMMINKLGSKLGD